MALSIKFYNRGKAGNISFRIRGEGLDVPYQEGTGTNDLEVAHEKGYAKLASMKRQLSAGKPLRIQRRLTLDCLKKLDVERADGDANNVSYKEKRVGEYWEALKRFAPLSDVYNITGNVLLAYRTHRSGLGYSMATIRKEFQALKRGLGVAADNGFKVNIPHKWPKCKLEKGKRARQGRYIPPEMMLRFFGELMRIDKRGSPAPFAMALFGLSTNWRCGEFERVRHHMIRPPASDRTDHMILEYEDGVRKCSNRDGMQAITANAAYAFDLFPPYPYCPQKTWNRAAKRAKLPFNPTLRDLRTSYATAAGQHSGDAYGVDLAMSHAANVPHRYQHKHEDRMAGVLAAVSKVYGSIIGFVTEA